MIRVYSQIEQGQAWLEQFRGCLPVFACVLGFTETGLIPGISAAGATPADRRYTAIADAEFLHHGVQPCPQYPLPPLNAGASPVLISRAIVEAQQIPVYLFNAGLPHPPSVPCVDLGGMPARCLTSGGAIDLPVVEHLLKQGLYWGKKLAAELSGGYLILGECVVGGTTTALAVLTGLGWNAVGKVNSSHPTCNHQQKWQVVRAGLSTLTTEGRAGEGERGRGEEGAIQSYALTQNSKLLTQNVPHPLIADPLKLVAAIGDPMQIVVAGMTIAASQTCGVLLAGGTQMLAVYALVQAIAQTYGLAWQAERVVVGTTRWVAEDLTGDTVGLAQMVNAPLMATSLSFATSQYAQFRAYERGYVKEGVGAGGCSIAASLYQGWGQTELLQAIETLAEKMAEKINTTESA
ncbi:MAG: nicotinate-nucleotide--dimethylbenzimidazole phosphoribosyltransferase [Cyanobacteria bacterium CRU_2_1]|nr:nicotinate-nucleotide--dimethylbenzimidazole phosphoribosyltransferase [Cyanobacteria bacterium RU_5_0]NJR59031.1 nicotinate-nucleotide--dimethylbenzimidazole phosphoribosyltransferase [Cyanobacteria bacterium CRU_2_1]